ncbi:MAG TPA: hypothetical protein VFS47_05440 [Steroidobacteraceae bacterium]|nr:hypothetical protein [Steroidobacteraceae bacterium]
MTVRSELAKSAAHPAWGFPACELTFVLGHMEAPCAGKKIPKRKRRAQGEPSAGKPLARKRDAQAQTSKEEAACAFSD